jgi:periplasmic protein TonB
MDSFGGFTQCMVDGDPESLRRERKNRRFGLALSLTLQVAVLGALVLVPLMSQAVPPLVNVNQIPLLKVPPRIPASQDPASRPATRTNVYPVPSMHSTPSPHHGSTIANAAGIDFDPGGFGTAGEATSVLGQPGLPEPPEIPAARGPDRPVVRGGKVMEALLIYRVEPKYPAIAKATRTSGDVVLNAIIATDGTINSLNVVSGNALLVRAATDAVSQWRYKPTTLDGQPVEVDTLVTVRFILQD